MSKPKILIFASGSAKDGGSGFENLVLASRNGTLNAEIVAVVSNHENGGVRINADKLKVPFWFFPKPWDDENYQRLAAKSGADFFPLSGWLKLITGLDPATRFNSRTVFNIHPGPLPCFGGPGLYGQNVHEAVIAAFKRGEITHSAVSMHFVTEEFDKGPVFFQRKIEISNTDTAETLGRRANKQEKVHQPRITNLVVNGLIKWDGINPESLEIPKGYKISN